MKNIWKVRIVDMCIYIDNHIYGEYDEEKVYSYLQYIYYSLAFKKKFFRRYEDYENYALYAAAQTYMRLINQRQFLPENDPKKLKKIKSVLNFAKRIMYPLKVNYQKNNFNDVIKIDETVEYDGKEIHEAMRTSLTEDVQNSVKDFVSIEVNNYIDTVSRIVKKVVDDTPYRKDKILKHRLYISCLMTLLRSVTLSNFNKKRLLNERGNIKGVSDNYIDSIYAEEQLNAPICWRLDNNFLPYIQVLYVRAKKIISDDIRSLIHDYDLTDDQIQDILMTPLAELNEED